MLLLILICFTPYNSIGHSVSKRDIIINEQIDSLLKDFSALIVGGGMQALPVNDIDKSFVKRVKFLKIKGSFKATNGSVSDIASVRRTGVATLVATPTSSTVTLHLGLGHLEVHYLDYKVTFQKISVSGDIRARVDTNSGFLQFTTYFIDEDTCRAVLDRVYVEELEDFSVEASNLGVLNWIYSEMAEWIYEEFVDEVQKGIEYKLTNLALKNGSNRKFCDLLRNM